MPLTSIWNVPREGKEAGGDGAHYQRMCTTTAMSYCNKNPPAPVYLIVHAVFCWGDHVFRMFVSSVCVSKAVLSQQQGLRRHCLSLSFFWRWIVAVWERCLSDRCNLPPSLLTWMKLKGQECCPHYGCCSNIICCRSATAFPITELCICYLKLFFSNTMTRISTAWFQNIKHLQNPPLNKLFTFFDILL